MSKRREIITLRNETSPILSNSAFIHRGTGSEKVSLSTKILNVQKSSTPKLFIGNWVGMETNILNLFLFLLSMGCLGHIKDTDHLGHVHEERAYFVTPEPGFFYLTHKSFVSLQLLQKVRYCIPEFSLWPGIYSNHYMCTIKVLVLLPPSIQTEESLF